MQGFLWGARPLPPLRPYQEAAIDGLRDEFRGGRHHVVLCAPTGSGKTVLAGHMTVESVSKGNSVGFLTERRVLAKQAHDYLLSFGLDAGLMMGMRTTQKAASCPILVASQQTLARRGFEALEGRRVIFIDEAHIRQDATIKWIKATRLANPDRVVVGLTATPFPAWMGDGFWESYVQAETTNALIAAGHLVRPDIFVAEAVIDMKGARRSAGGEWAASEAEERGLAILGDIVQTWSSKTNEYFGGPVKTLLFSPTRDYGLQLVAEFRQAGHRFVYVGDRDGLSEAGRIEVMQDFRAGRVTGLISCEALGRGLDVPDVMCSVHARPRRASISAHIQETGRVLRPAEGKATALIIDHCNNFPRFRDETALYFEHGFPGFSEYAEARQKRKGREEETAPDAVCKACGFVMLEAADKCPACGEVVRKPIGVRWQSVEIIEARLAKFRLGRSSEAAEERIFMWEQIVGIAKRRGKTKNWSTAQYRALMGEWPPRTYRAADEIIQEIETYIWKRWVSWCANKSIRRRKAMEMHDFLESA